MSPSSGDVATQTARCATFSPGHYRLSTPLPVTGTQLPCQLTRLVRWGCRHVELARSDVSQQGKPFWLHLRRALDDAGVRVAAIVSSTEDGQGWRVEDLEEAFELAKSLGAERVVTLAPPLSGTCRWGHDQVEAWLKTVVALAKQAGIRLLVENCPRSWADTGHRLDQLVSMADTRWLGVAFDPVGFVALREHPFLVSFKPSRFKVCVDLLRISDALFENGTRVEVSQGNAEITELVSALLARSFQGFFSVSSHVPGASLGQIEEAFAGFAGLVASLAVD